MQPVAYNNQLWYKLQISRGASFARDPAATADPKKGLVEHINSNSPAHQVAKVAQQYLRESFGNGLSFQAVSAPSSGSLPD
jgi:hypothetical protein